MAATNQSGCQSIGRSWRYYSSVSLTSAALGAGGTALLFQDMSSISVSASSTQGATTLTMYGAQASSTGPFRPTYDEDNAAVSETITVPCERTLKSANFPRRWVRLQADAACVVDVFMKG